MALRKYKRRPGATVYAIRFDFAGAGFDYEKWGASQHCKSGDWIVLNDGDTYTVDADVFGRTYRRVDGATYEKTGNVWAEQASTDGAVPTKEGRTHYTAGDYVVFNDESKTDGYAMTRDKFESMYEAAEG